MRVRVSIVVMLLALLGSSMPLSADEQPGAFEKSQLEPIAQIAGELSLDRAWMTEDLLSRLEHESVRLDKAVPGAPAAFVDGRSLYAVYVEKVGSLWTGFEPASDPYFVFLTHEAYQGLGEEKALAFQDGLETVVRLDDFDILPALGLTVEEISLDPFTAIDPPPEADPSPPLPTDVGRPGQLDFSRVVPTSQLAQYRRLIDLLSSRVVMLDTGEELPPVSGVWISS